VAFSVHALHVADVVAVLRVIAGNLPGAGSRHGAYQESGARPSRGGLTVAANSRARRRAQYRAERGAAHPAVGRSLVGRSAARLHAGILSAVHIVGAKLIKTPARAGHHQDTWSGRKCRARAHHYGRQHG
jgi:hypothetical protein